MAPVRRSSGSGARLDRVRELTGAACRALYQGSFNKWYFDELNDLLFVRIGGKVADGVRVVRRARHRRRRQRRRVASPRRPGDEIRHIQTGRVQNYALGIAGGLIVIAVELIFLVDPLMLDLDGHPDPDAASSSTPLVGALVLAFVPGDNVRAITRGRARASRWSRSGCRCIAVLGFDTASARHGRLPVPRVVAWIPFFGINYQLGMDGISLLLVVLTTLLTWISHPRQLRAHPDAA